LYYYNDLINGRLQQEDVLEHNFRFVRKALKKMGHGGRVDFKSLEMPDRYGYQITIYANKKRYRHIWIFYSAKPLFLSPYDLHLDILKTIKEKGGREEYLKHILKIYYKFEKRILEKRV